MKPHWPLNILALLIIGMNGAAFDASAMAHLAALAFMSFAVAVGFLALNLAIFQFTLTP